MGRGVWLYGGNMGGGFGGAVRAHVAKGLTVAATVAASAALHDDPGIVRGMGVEIAERCPPGCVPLRLGDFSAQAWTLRLAQLGLPLPNLVLAAAQDHGRHDEGGSGPRNCEGRMRIWGRLLAAGGAPEGWLYDDVPPELTRLKELQAQTGGPVADTGTAAILGALSEPAIRERAQRQGITVLNAGNGHTFAALVSGGRVCALYEHHAGMREADKVLEDMARFRRGILSGDEVRSTGGHGAVYAGDFAPGAFVAEGAEAADATYVLGPQREMFRGAGRFAAPHGDMMMAGCFGLLSAFVGAGGWTRMRPAAGKASA
jgi:uncharacterized protein (DUF1786 family)